MNLCSTCAIPSWYRFLNKGIYLLHLQCTSLLQKWSLVCKKDTVRMAMGFLGGSVVKNLPETQEKRVQSLGWEDPWRRAWQPTSVSLPGEFHGWKSLVSYIQGVAKSVIGLKRLSMRVDKGVCGSLTRNSRIVGNNLTAFQHMAWSGWKEKE